MNTKNNLKPVVASLGTALILGVSSMAMADTANPFATQSLDSGYQLAEKSAEGKCGEGKCGEAKEMRKAEEGKCGEGKCGADKKDDMKGEKKGDMKAEEGKCGEGKCGSAG